MINCKTTAVSIGAICLLTYLCVTTVSAQTNSGSLAGIGRQQPDATKPSTPTLPPDDSNSLDISPQQIEPLSIPHLDEIPQENPYTDSESNEEARRNFSSETNDDGRGAARLGVTVESVQRAYDEVVANECHPFSLSHRAPEIVRPVRILIRGLEVMSVRPGSPASMGGLRGRNAGDQSAESQFVSWLLPDRSPRGDLIIAVNGAPVSSQQDLDHSVSSTATGDDVSLTVLRTDNDDGEPTENLITLTPFE